MNIIDIEYFTRPDYYFNAYYPYVGIKNIYNTLLLPVEIVSKYNNLFENNKVNILDKTKKVYPQSVVFDTKKILNILDKQFSVMHIAPGFEIDYDRFVFTMKINDNEYEIDQFLTNTNKVKLIIGLIVLDDNYHIRFNNNDKISIKCDNSTKYGKSLSVFNKYNYYTGNKINTIIDITDNSNYDLLHALNSLQNMSYKKYVVSHDTRKNNQKGSISLNIKYPKKLSIFCKDINHKIIDKQTYTNGKSIYFKNLIKGKYIIEVYNDTGHDRYDIRNNNTIVDSLLIEVYEYIEDKNNNYPNKLLRLPRQKLSI